MRKHLILAVCLAGVTAAACGDDDDDAGSGGSSEAGRPSSGNGGGGTGGRASGGSGAAGRSNAGTSAGGAGGTAGNSSRAGTGAGGTSAGSSAGDDAGAAGDIVETATAAGTFTQLTAALTKAGLVDALKGAGPFTVFAPSDAAFAALEQAQPGLVASLSTDELATVLKYHVISGAAIKSTDLKDKQLAESLAGSPLAVSIAGGTVKIDDSTVVTADIVAENGIIHVVDKVILPPGDIIEVATQAGGFTKLAAALTSANLVDTLKGAGPFTVFAPTDAAFDALGSAAPTGETLATVLKYHVISGKPLGQLDLKEGGAAWTVAASPVLFTLAGGAAIDDAKITTTNIVAKNGVIHVIDKVIVPPSQDIVEVATAQGFSSLASALTSADLVDTLQGAGPYTVFAPTNEAFAALTTAPTGDALRDVLLYHVVEGAVGSGDLKAGAVPTLLANESLTIDLTGGVKVNTTPVTTANVLAKNGIIHVIGSVLVPN